MTEAAPPAPTGPVRVVRVVLARFRDAHRTRADREAVRAAAEEAFPRIPGVVAFRTGLPADDEAAQDWDLLLEVGFADLAHVAPYREHHLHVEFLDTHLRPRLEHLKARNFDLAPPGATSPHQAGGAGGTGSS